MSFNEVMAGLPALSVEQRQLLVRRALELDDAGLSPAEERLAEERRTEYLREPSSAQSLEQIEKHLRAGYGPRCGE